LMMTGHRNGVGSFRSLSLSLGIGLDMRNSMV
jgi:hypothetical protein